MARWTYLLFLLLLVHSGNSLRRQTRQLPRIPFLDNLLARFQGRPSTPPQRVRPPQFEGGFTPLSSIADSVDLTFQSLDQQRRPVGQGPPNRPQIDTVGPDGFGRPPPNRPPQIDTVGPDGFGRPPPNRPPQIDTVGPDGFGRPPPNRPPPNRPPQIDTVRPDGFGRPPPNLPPAPFPPSPVQPQSVPFLTPPVQRQPLTGSAPFPPQTAPISPPSAPFPQTSASQPSTEAARRATLREVLKEDCPDFEDRGYCESPHQYPTAQVHSLMTRCSRIVESLYVPLPVDSNSISSPVKGYFERANHETWSWAQYSKQNSICASESHTVTPSYARDASGKWVVVLQHGNMVQRVPVDRCVNVGAPCLSDFQAAHCEQRQTHHHMVTWDPDAPNDCPTLRVFAFPTACLCKLGGAKT